MRNKKGFTKSFFFVIIWPIKGERYMTNTRAIPDSFVAISDFHSCEYPLEKEKIFILGDMTDRSPDDQEGLNDK